MYLLDTKTEQLCLFQNLSTCPKYAILSHTWLPADQEILFKHVESRTCPDKCFEGIKKVLGCCRQAKKDGFDWVWIDTCCIDKSSSAELSEAINSMYQIYAKSARCYAYLSDVYVKEGVEALDSPFRRSRWFTRGWTLQELIAPSIVEFFTSDWRFIGDKDNLAMTVEEVTGVESTVLSGICPITEVPVAKVMSYAAKRETTRTEDRAYSLLGLCGVNMPTIYGEGDNAFARLQYEIMSRSPAHSLLAWKSVRSDKASPVLAPSPSYFAKSRNVVEIPYGQFVRAWNLEGLPVGFQKGPHGLQANLPVFDMPPGRGDIHAIIVIACKVIDPIRKRQHTIGLPLTRVEDRFYRPFSDMFINVDCLMYLNVPWSHKSITLQVERDQDFSRGGSGGRGVMHPTGIIINRRVANITFVETSTQHRARGYDLISNGRPNQVCS